MANLSADAENAVNTLVSRTDDLMSSVAAFTQGNLEGSTEEFQLAVDSLDQAPSVVESAVYGSAYHSKGETLPSLIADFSEQQYLVGPRRIEGGVEFDDLFDFSRASTKWVLGPNGGFIEYGVNEPAYVYDPDTGKCLGIHLHSYQTTNLLANSGDATKWSKNAFGVATREGPLWGNMVPTKLSRSDNSNEATFDISFEGTTGNWYTLYFVIAPGDTSEIDITLRWFKTEGWIRNTFYMPTGKWRVNNGMSVTYNDGDPTNSLIWHEGRVLDSGVVIGAVSAFAERDGDDAAFDFYLGSSGLYTDPDNHCYLYLAQVIPGISYDDLYVPTGDYVETCQKDVMKLPWDSGYVPRAGNWTYYADLWLTYSQNFMSFFSVGMDWNYRGLGITVDSSSTRFYYVAQSPDTRFKAGNSEPLDGELIKCSVSYDRDTAEVVGSVRGTTDSMDLSENNFHQYTEFVQLMPGKPLRGTGGKNAGIYKKLVAYPEVHSAAKQSEMTNV